MSDDANLLEMLDTTVTLEWESTRSIGTLVGLGGHAVQVTALRAPEVGAQVYLRIENDDPAQVMALDGLCSSVTDSDWGEQQVEVRLMRVGTTASAAVLRDFIEKHGIERGGTVSVGRNRDNPDLKRFVYSLPESPAAGPSKPAPRDWEDLPQSVMAPAAVAAPAMARVSGERPTVPTPAAPAPAPVRSATAAPSPAAAAIRPSSTAANAPFSLGAGDDDLASALADVVQSLESPGRAADADATRVAAAVRPSQPSLAELARPRPAAAMAPTSAAIAPPPAAVAAAAPPQRDADHDASEQILVNIVDAGSQAASPVVDTSRRSASSSVMQRILGIGKGSSGNQPAGGVAQGPASATALATPGRLASSDKLASAAELYAGGQAQRVDMKVQFEAGPKKRKYDGLLQRLSETKLRVATQVLPAPYERLMVYLPGKGPKDGLALQCEVTRVHTNDSNGEGSFDARLTAGGNPGPVMARLRQVLQELGGGAAP